MPDIDDGKSLDEYGLDSLSASKVTNALAKEFGVELSVFMFIADPTIQVSVHLLITPGSLRDCRVWPKR